MDLENSFEGRNLFFITFFPRGLTVVGGGEVGLDRLWERNFVLYKGRIFVGYENWSFFLGVKARS